jgi:hypothetical protein
MKLGPPKFEQNVEQSSRGKGPSLPLVLAVPLQAHLNGLGAEWVWPTSWELVSGL